MTQNIGGKVVVITGASSGLGEATARHLASLGAKLVLGARRLDRLEALAKELNLPGDAAVQTDVTDREQVTRLVDGAVAAHGRIDVIVNNAGLMPHSPLERGKADDWDRMIDVNLKGVLYGIAAALPVFRRQGRGHLVTTVSTAGLKIVPTQAVYAATKNAVRTLLEGLRQESTDGVLRTTTVSPGFVRTELADSIDNPEAREQIRRSRDEFAISPDAVARAIAFAVEQPDDVEIGDITIRPTVQG
jgi:NADP-dependent 3-hydroxy acid dehydrogenase YdfG